MMKLTKGACIFCAGIEILFETRIAGSFLAVEDTCAGQYHRRCADGTYTFACLVLGDECLAYSLMLIEVGAARHSTRNHQHIGIFKTLNILETEVGLDGNSVGSFYKFTTGNADRLDIYAPSAEDVNRSQSFDFLEAIGKKFI